MHIANRRRIENSGFANLDGGIHLALTEAILKVMELL